MYVKYNYSPCYECKRRYESWNCRSCEINALRDEVSSLRHKVETELEPRIRAERQAYDRFIATQRE